MTTAQPQVTQGPFVSAFVMADHFKHDELWFPRVKAKADRVRGAFESISSDFPPESLRLYKSKAGYTFLLQKELYDLVGAIEQAMPGVDFSIEDYSVLRADDKTYYYADALFVYREGEPYAMGIIHHKHTNWLKLGRNRVCDEDERAYIIQSPWISNKAYAPRAEGYNAYVTKKMDVALGHVKKYLRSYSPVDVAYLSSRKFTRHVYTPISREVEKKDNMAREIHNKALDVAKELQRVVSQGVDGGDVALREKVANYFKQQEVVAEMTARIVVGHLVMLRPNGTVSITETSGQYPTAELKTVDKITVYESTDALPETVQYALASLSMLDHGAYVEGIGTAVTERLYWLENV